MHRVIKSALIAVPLAALASKSAFAAECDKILREDALQECLSGELSVADKELNATYGKLRGQLDKGRARVANQSPEAVDFAT